MPFKGAANVRIWNDEYATIKKSSTTYASSGDQASAGTTVGYALTVNLSGTGIDHPTVVTITDVLPQYVSYVPGSSFFAGVNVEPDCTATPPTPNTTQCTWTLPGNQNVKTTNIGDPSANLAPLQFNAFISAKAPNNITILNAAKVHSTQNAYAEPGSYSSSSGYVCTPGQKCSSGLFNLVINTNNGATLSKQVDKSRVNANEGFTWNLIYGAVGQTLSNTKLIDILPYPNDRRASPNSNFAGTLKLNGPIVPPVAGTTPPTLADSNAIVYYTNNAPANVDPNPFTDNNQNYTGAGTNSAAGSNWCIQSQFNNPLYPNCPKSFAEVTAFAVEPKGADGSGVLQPTDSYKLIVPVIAAGNAAGNNYANNYVLDSKDLQLVRNPPSNTVYTKVVAPDLVIIKTAPASAVAGSSLPYTIIVANNTSANNPNVGVVPLTTPPSSITMTDPLPSGVVFTAATNVSGTNWDCSASTAPSSVSCAYTGSYPIGIGAQVGGNITVNSKVSPTAPAGNAVNTASVVLNTPAGPGTPKTSSATTAIGSSPDLAVVKTASRTSATNLVYNIMVSNVGISSSAASFPVNDTVPLGVRIDSAKIGTANVTCSPALPFTGDGTAMLSCTVPGPLAGTGANSSGTANGTGGGSVTLTLSSTLLSTYTGMSNKACAMDPSDTNTGNNCGTTPTQPFISHVKTIASGPTATATPNQFSVVYNIVATNNGAASGTYDLSDSLNLSAALTVNSIAVSKTTNGGASTTVAGPFSTVNDTPLTLATGQALAAAAVDTYVMTVVYTEDFSKATTANNSCTNTTTTGAGNGLLNVASLTTSGTTTPMFTCKVLPPSNFHLYVVKTASRTSATALVYSIKVSNVGISSSSPSFPVSDTVPLGVRIDTVTGATCPVGSLPFTGDGMKMLTCTVFGSLAGTGADSTGKAIGTGGGSTTLVLSSTLLSNYAGMVNKACANDPNDSSTANNCASSPPQSVISHVKTIASGPTPTAVPNQFSVVYNIVATNNGAGASTYDLTDTLNLSAALTVNSIAVSLNGTALTGSFKTANNTPNTLATAQPLAAAAVDTYAMTVVYTEDYSMATTANMGCTNTTTTGPGNGLLNVASLTANSTTNAQYVCQPLLPSNPDLMMVKTASRASTNNLIYNIKITNVGISSSSASFPVTDTVPNGVRIDTVTVNGAPLACSTPLPFTGDGSKMLSCTVTGSLAGTGAKPDGTANGTGGGTVSVVLNSTLLPNYLGVPNNACVKDPLDKNAANDCASSAPQAVITHVKTIVNGPTPQAIPNQFKVVYSIVATNNGVGPSNYDLSDTLNLSPALTINSIAVTRNSAALAGPFSTVNDTPLTLATNLTLVSTASDTYLVTVVYTEDYTLATTANMGCTNTTTSAGTGNGLLNVASLTTGGSTVPMTACAPLTPSIPDLAIGVISAPGTNPATDLIYNIKVRNVGITSSSSSYPVNNTIPVGVTVNSVTGKGVTCSPLPFVGDGVKQLTCTVTGSLVGTGAQSDGVTPNGTGGGSTTFGLVTTVSNLYTGTVEKSCVRDPLDKNPKNDCAPSAAQGVITHVKTITSGPTATAVPNQFSVVYNIVATNNGAGAGTYDLSDTLNLSAAVTVNTISATRNGTPLTATLTTTNNTANVLATAQPLAAAAVDTYALTVVYTEDFSMVTPTNMGCTNTTTTAPGNGLLNVASLTVNGVTTPMNVCKVLPPSNPDLTVGIVAAQTSPTALTYNIKVSNVGVSSSSPTYSVFDTVPVGATVTAVTGTGVTCSPLPFIGDGVKQLTCTVTGSLAGTGAKADGVTPNGTGGGSIGFGLVTTLAPTYTGMVDKACVRDPLDMNPANDCATSAGQAVITHVKTFSSGPSPTALPNQFTVVYNIVATNSGTVPGTYDLSDTLNMSPALAVNSIAATRNGTQLPGPFSTASQAANVLAAAMPLGAAATDTYTVTVVYTETYTQVTTANASCTNTSASGPGNGLLNVATLKTTGTSTPQSACNPLGPVVLAPTGASSIPTLNQWGLLFLILGMLGVAGTQASRRRYAAPKR